MIPPCHHWSWSSTNEASDHFTTRRRSVFSPSAHERRHVELGGQVRVLRQAGERAVDATTSTLSAAPTCRTTRRSRHVVGELERPLVDPGRVVLRHARRMLRERHLDVRVDWGRRRCPASSSSRERRCRATRHPARRRRGRAAGIATRRRAAKRSVCGTECIASRCSDVSSGASQNRTFTDSHYERRLRVRRRRSAAEARK